MALWNDVKLADWLKAENVIYFDVNETFWEVSVLSVTETPWVQLSQTSSVFHQACSNWVITPLQIIYKVTCTYVTE